MSHTNSNITSLKINVVMEVDGSDHFPALNSKWVICRFQPLIFQGVSLIQIQNGSHFFMIPAHLNDDAPRNFGSCFRGGTGSPKNLRGRPTPKDLFQEALSEKDLIPIFTCYLNSKRLPSNTNGSCKSPWIQTEHHLPHPFFVLEPFV